MGVGPTVDEDLRTMDVAGSRTEQELDHGGDFLGAGPAPERGDEPVDGGAVQRIVETRLQQGPSAWASLSDSQDVVVGSTNASLFAYVADGVNGLKVVQLTAPDTQPKFYGPPVTIRIAERTAG